MLDIPQAVLNDLANRHGLDIEVFGYICRMKRESDGKSAMRKLALGQSGSTDSAIHAAWLRATFLYWERGPIGEFTATSGPGGRALLPRVETPEEAADLAAREGGLTAAQAAELGRRVRICPRISRLQSYPMAQREPVFPHVPDFLALYAAGHAAPHLPDVQINRNLQTCRRILGDYLASGRPLSDSPVLAFLYKEVCTSDPEGLGGSAPSACREDD